MFWCGAAIACGCVHAPAAMFSILRLRGKTAAIESIEQDYEGNVHVCVVVDDDPGRDIGLMRQPGHRFFFATSEVEPLAPRAKKRQRPDDETNTDRRDWKHFSG